MYEGKVEATLQINWELVESIVTKGKVTWWRNPSISTNPSRRDHTNHCIENLRAQVWVIFIHNRENLATLESLATRHQRIVDLSVSHHHC